MKHISAIIFALAIVIAAYFLGNAYIKRANPPQIISVTGLGNENFTSDLIVWEGQFVKTHLVLDVENNVPLHKGMIEVLL